MPSVRRRTVSLAVASALVLGSAAGPSAAADDPEAALTSLLEAVTARELEDLDGLVCAEGQEAVREAFGDAGLGIDLMALSFDPVGVSIEEPTIAILTSDDTTASARVTATLAIDVEDQQMREFVREIIEASAGPDDLPVTDDDVDEMVPLAADAMGLRQPLDAEIGLTLEDGEWVVCGGFGGVNAESGDRYAVEASVSTEGLCGLATPAEVSELGLLEYDSSTGFGEFCTYSQSDWDAYHAATVSLILEASLDDWREVYPPDGELEVAGAQAFSSGQDVFTASGEDVLQVSVSLPQDASSGNVDPVTQAVRISELFLPRLDELLRGGSEPEDASASTPGASLCDGVALDELNAASGRAFDTIEGDAWGCTWSSSDPSAGLDIIVATVTDLTLEEFRELLDETDESEIEGLPAISTGTQAIVELPDGRTLDVSVYYDERTGPALPADTLASTLAGWIALEVTAEPDATD